MAKIVVADDDAANCYATVRALQNAGHEVVGFESSIHAWNAVKGSIDILVTDVVFPPDQPHGLALATHARSLHSKLRVVFITAFADHANGLASTGETAFAKPLEIEKLVSILNTDGQF